MKRWIIVAALLALAGCNKQTDKLTQLPPIESAGTQGEAVPVSTVNVVRANVTRRIVATGTTEAAHAADIGPQMTARVNAVLVDEGDLVKAGQPLVKLDVVDAELRAQQSAANVESMKAQYEQAKGEYERLAPLLERGTVTAQQLQRLASQRDALKASLDAAQVAEANARHSVTTAIVRAPFAGVVSKVSIEVGEIATMAPAKVLVRLVDLSSVDVRVRVHERELARIKVGNDIHGQFPSTGETAEGQVTFISPEIDPRTRTAEVVTRIPNTEGHLRAGMFAEISINPHQTQESLTIPSTAVAGTGEDRYVFTLGDGVVQKRNVRVAPVDATTVEVLEGLREGDTIVRDGIGKLSDNLRVKVTGVNSPNAKAQGEKP